MVTEETGRLIQSLKRKVAVTGFGFGSFTFHCCLGGFVFHESLLGRRGGGYTSEGISSSQFLKPFLLFLNESWVAKSSLYV